MSADLTLSDKQCPLCRVPYTIWTNASGEKKHRCYGCGWREGDDEFVGDKEENARRRESLK